jgi:putative oxidoreductase
MEDIVTHLPAGWGDGLLFVGRCCPAAIFAVSASSKFRQVPAEVKLLANLHIPAPATVEVLVGVCEAVGTVALVFGIFTRLASILLAIFMIVISFVVLSFWNNADPPPVRAQNSTPSLPISRS